MGVLALCLLMAVYGPGHGPDGPGGPEKPETNPVLHAEHLLSQQLSQKIMPWGRPCSWTIPGCLWPWTWPDGPLGPERP